jgi:hypothetical protein
VALALFAPGGFDQNPPHGFGGGREEMPTAIPPMVPRTDESQPSLVHEGGGLEGLARHFVGHLVRRELAQFVVDQRQEFLGGLSFALVHAIQDACDLAHSCGLCVQSLPHSSLGAKVAKKRRSDLLFSTAHNRTL